MLKGIDFLNKIQDGKNRMKIIVFLTDGQASKGEQNREKLPLTLTHRTQKKYDILHWKFISFLETGIKWVGLNRLMGSSTTK
jgi:hypothetical protein